MAHEGLDFQRELIENRYSPLSDAEWEILKEEIMAEMSVPLDETAAWFFLNKDAIIAEHKWWAEEVAKAQKERKLAALSFAITGEPHTNDELPELIAALEPYDSKDFETAIKLLTPIAETGNLTALFKLANCHRDVGNLELARHIYELGIAHGDSRCMNNLANLYRKDGDLDAAFDLYQKAAESGQNLESVYNLAVQLDKRGETWAAIEWAKKSFEAGYIRAPSLLSILLDKEAERFHQVALEMKSLTALGIEIGRLMTAGKLEAALELVDKVDIHYVDASEEHQIGVYCWAAGSLLFILKDFARAAEYLEIALQHRHRLTQEQIKKAEEMLKRCRNKSSDSEKLVDFVTAKTLDMPALMDLAKQHHHHFGLCEICTYISDNEDSGSVIDLLFQTYKSELTEEAVDLLIQLLPATAESSNGGYLERLETEFALHPKSSVGALRQGAKSFYQSEAIEINEGTPREDWQVRDILISVDSHPNATEEIFRDWLAASHEARESLGHVGAVDACLICQGHFNLVWGSSARFPAEPHKLMELIESGQLDIESIMHLTLLHAHKVTHCEACDQIPEHKDGATCESVPGFLFHVYQDKLNQEAFNLIVKTLDQTIDYVDGEPWNLFGLSLDLHPLSSVENLKAATVHYEALHMYHDRTCDHEAESREILSKVAEHKQATEEIVRMWLFVTHSHSSGGHSQEIDACEICQSHFEEVWVGKPRSPSDPAARFT